MTNAAASVPSARYPWHQANWSALPRDLGRLPHALLLHGPTGVGKLAFGVQLAQALLCQQPGTELMACGHCRNCGLLSAGNHPDFNRVGPLEPRKPITVDQIRAIGEFMALRPHTAPRKVTLIAPADAMNLNAVNSLLKVLEEPPPGGVLLLVSSHPMRLAATVRSRCAAIRFFLPPPPEALSWLGSQDTDTDRHAQALALASGAPLTAAEGIRRRKLRASLAENGGRRGLRRYRIARCYSNRAVRRPEAPHDPCVDGVIMWSKAKASRYQRRRASGLPNP